MAITAQMVKELRERTGAGMMDCKKALVEADGDMEKAVDWLREKGMAKAAKKADRATAEGLVVCRRSADGKHAVLASLLCETDFVSRGDKFQAMADRAAEVILEKAPADLPALEALLGDEVAQLIATVGENMRLGRFFRHTRQSEHEVWGQYVHANGKIGVLVWLTVGKPENREAQAVLELVKDLAMQVAAANPAALDGASLDPALVEREREVYRKKALAEGKPENIVDKIADGAVKKMQKDICLMEQPYIRDDKKSVSDIVREAAKTVGDTITVCGFSRVHLTEG